MRGDFKAKNNSFGFVYLSTIKLTLDLSNYHHDGRVEPTVSEL